MQLDAALDFCDDHAIDIAAVDHALRDLETMTQYLAGIGVDYQRWQLSEMISLEAAEEEILAGLKEIQEQGGAELGEVIQALKQQRIDRERSNA